jgi:hypothetical protein
MLPSAASPSTWPSRSTSVDVTIPRPAYTLA